MFESICVLVSRLTNLDSNFDEYFLDLPDDPEEAFVVFQAKKFEELREILQSQRPNHWRNERDFIYALQAFDETYGLNILNDLNVPDDDEEFGHQYGMMIILIKKEVTKIQLRRAIRIKKGAESIVVLDAASRQGIRKLVDTIKEKLDDLSFDELKRRALYEKLNAFVSELDQNLTRTQAFDSFAVQIARTFGTASKEIKPLWDRIDRVLDWLEKAKTWTGALPKPTDKKQIEPPKEKLPAPSADDVSPL
ncbi:MAG: hypothetical protein Rhirs2KO_33330 [Rhizobiaceae bacterium]